MLVIGLDSNLPIFWTDSAGSNLYEESAQNKQINLRITDFWIVDNAFQILTLHSD